MRFLIALSAALGPGIAALDFPRAITGNGYVSIPVGTVDRPLGGLTKRQAIETVLQNKDFFYAMNVSIGTPPQPITVLVDTGSSELWVNPNCATAPTAQQAAACRSFGRYTPSRSTTPPRGPFGSQTIQYGDPSDPNTQTSVDIRYYADSVAMGAATILNQTFGVVVQSSGQSQGILGLAPDLRAGFNEGQPYSLVLNSMAAQGLIASRVFSLDLRHADAETGAVIYGGLDRGKFIGRLEQVPLANGLRGEPRLGASLTSIGTTLNSPIFYPIPQTSTSLMLDSGTTLTRLHSSIASPILRDLNAISDGEGYWLTECAYRRTRATVDFGFGNMTLRVPMRDFILDLGDGQYCYIGLVITSDQQIAGDSVLRAGYFVFDWDNQSVHIAQAANCGDEIVAASSGPDAVPDVTGLCRADGQTASIAPTMTSAPSRSAPTAAYTTTYTITSCPSFDASCRTGRITTEIFIPPQTGSESNPTNAPAPTQTKSSVASSWMPTKQITPLLVTLLAISVFSNI